MNAPHETEPYGDIVDKAHSLAHTSAARLANARKDARMSAQAHRIDATQAALAGTLVVQQFKESFPPPAGRQGGVARALYAALTYAPALALIPDPEKSGTVGSAVLSPRLWPAALIAGIVAAKELLPGTTIRIDRNIPELDQGRRFKLQLLSRIDPEKVEWASDNVGTLTVDKGVVNAVGGGNSATITAKLDGYEDSVVVRVR